METNQNNRLSPIENCKGFVLILTLPLMLLLSIGALFFAFMFFQSTFQSNFKTTLLEALYKQHRQQGVLYQKLSELNTPAKLLKIQYYGNVAKIAVATAYFRIDLLPGLIKENKKIQSARRTLDRQQQVLIRAIQALQKLEFAYVSWQMQKFLQKANLRFANLVQFKLLILPKKTPEFAMRPVDQELAPEFVPRDNFQQLQSLEVSLRVAVLISGPKIIQSLFPKQWKTSSAITLEVRNAYNPQIIRPGFGRTSFN